MFKNQKKVKLTVDTQLDIFETIFLHLLDIPSMRWKLKRMIESREKVDQAELDLKLKVLEIEILQQKGGDV